ncbi:MAG: MFS transporter [Planctomycetota bacterium]
MFREYVRNVRLFSRNARILLLSTFIGSLGLGMVWVLRNLYLRRIGFNDAQIGNVLSAAAMGLVAAAPTALWMDRLRLKGFLLFAGLAGTLGLYGQLVTDDYDLIRLAAFLSGFGGSLAGLAGAPFVMRNSGTSERVYLFGVTIAVATLGSFASMMAAAACTRLYGDTADVQRWVMTGGCVVGFLAGIPLFFIQEPPLTLKETISPLRSLRNKDWGTIGKLCLPDFLIGCGAGLTIPFINLYYETRFGIPSDRISVYYAISQFVNMLGFMASPVIANRLGLVRSVVVSQLLSTPFFAILAVTTNLRLAVGAFLLRNMLMNMVQPVNSNFAMEVVPEDQRAFTNCVKGIAWNLPWVPAASLGGWVVHYFQENRSSIPWAASALGVRDGFTLTMYLTISLYLVAATVFYVFFRNHHHAVKKGANEVVKAAAATAGGSDGK